LEKVIIRDKSLVLGIPLFETPVPRSAPLAIKGKDMTSYLMSNLLAPLSTLS
jgi:hypothetical protein